MHRFILVTIASLFFGSAWGSSGKTVVGLNLYGLSHHFLTNGESRKRFSEFNPGAGFSMTWRSSQGNWTTLEGGMYRDTFRRPAKYAAAGYHLRLVSELRVGAIFGVYSSRSIRDGETIPLLLPVVSLHQSVLTLHVVYLPKFRDINPWNTLGTYLTISLNSSD